MEDATILGIIILLTILSIWETVWKAMGMWRSARNGQIIWFVCIMFFNTVGILPIVYLGLFQRPQKANNVDRK